MQFHNGHNCGICSSVCPYGLKHFKGNPTGSQFLVMYLNYNDSVAMDVASSSIDMDGLQTKRRSTDIP